MTHRRRAAHVAAGTERAADRPPTAAASRRTPAERRRSTATRTARRRGDADRGSTATSAEDGRPARALAPAERDEYLDSLRRLQADFENYQKRMRQQQAEQVGPGRRGTWSTSCCRCSTRSTWPRTTSSESPTSSEAQGAAWPRRGAAARHPRQGGPRADRPARRAVRPDRARGGRRTCRHGRGRRADGRRDRSSTRCCGPGTAGRAGAAPGHGPGAGVKLSTMAASANGSRRTTTRCSGSSPTATDKEITRAYRKLAKQHHPDANPGSEERFKEITRRLRRPR